MIFLLCAPLVLCDFAGKENEVSRKVAKNGRQAAKSKKSQVETMIIGIVAISKNYAIGKDGKLPWHYSADLKFFKETTTGNAVVMGANTWRSIGKPLPNRLNVVLSRSGNIDTPPSVIRLSSKGEVVELARYLNRDVFIIGGAQTYEDFADVIEQWIVTFIPADIEDADTFIPADFLGNFSESDSIDLADGLTVKKYLRIE